MDDTPIVSLRGPNKEHPERWREMTAKEIPLRIRARLQCNRCMTTSRIRYDTYITGISHSNKIRSFSCLVLYSFCAIDSKKRLHGEQHVVVMVAVVVFHP